MSKVVICGIEASGKTCYFYGMLRKMMVGVHGFMIRPQLEDDEKLYGRIKTEIKRLGDTSLPLDERFPLPNAKSEKYKLDLCHNYKSIEVFDWIDYPGEYVSIAAKEFLGYLEGADCLIICVDGARIKGSADDLDSIVEEFQFDCGGMDLNNALGIAAQKNNDQLPPVCILVTKYDAISPELRNKESIEYIVKNVFNVLFSDESASGGNRIATICTVSLGKDIANGGKLAPIRVEAPICFAAYLIKAKAQRQAMETIAAARGQYNEKLEQHKRKGFFKKIFSPEPEFPMSLEEAQNKLKTIEQCEENMKNLEPAIEMMQLFVNGEEKGWSELFD